MPFGFGAKRSHAFLIFAPFGTAVRTVYVLSSPHLKDIFTPIWSGPFLEHNIQQVYRCSTNGARDAQILVTTIRTSPDSMAESCPRRQCQKRVHSPLFLDEYIAAAGIVGDANGYLFRTTAPKSGVVTERPMHHPKSHSLQDLPFGRSEVKITDS
jgi:hypothetical protein